MTDVHDPEFDELDYLAHVLVVELAGQGFTMPYSYARATLDEHVDGIVELSGLPRSEVIADHVTEEGVEILAWSLARVFLAQEHEANRDHPGVMLRPTACFELVETLGSGVNELMGMDRHEGVAVAGEMISVIANGLQKYGQVHLSGAGCRRLSTALLNIAQATDPRHSTRGNTTHADACRATEQIATASLLARDNLELSYISSFRPCDE